eukprot:6177296-Pleurochrysis_carterae.AAC.1
MESPTGACRRLRAKTGGAERGAKSGAKTGVRHARRQRGGGDTLSPRTSPTVPVYARRGGSCAACMGRADGAQ